MQHLKQVPGRKTGVHVKHLEALGYCVTLDTAA
jgi:hypothetical protein